MKCEQIKKIILNALNKLAKYDEDIFKQKLPKLGKSAKKERKLNRELHETALNHRFAFYLENELLKEQINGYHVDIEYNRNFSDQKRVKLGNLRIPVRPDILIHKRMRTNETLPHLLVIEAKKHKINQHDINKVEGFMKDEKYLYKFGLTISYAYDQSKVKGTFYFKDENGKIKTELLTVDRKKKSP